MSVHMCKECKDRAYPVGKQVGAEEALEKAAKYYEAESTSLEIAGNLESDAVAIVYANVSKKLRSMSKEVK